ncbi:DUF2218 domain-containing protein [Spirillospora sp. NPDC047418]
MLSVEAHVETDRPGRYLVQLCRHGNQMSRHLNYRPRAHGEGIPPKVEDAEWSDTRGTIRFSGGQCILRATPDGLVLRVEAAHETDLRQIQNGLAGRLEKIGRRDHLKVEWQGPEAPRTPFSEAAELTALQSVDRAATHPHPLKTIGLTLAIALAIAFHLGLGGALLADYRWTSWAADIVLAGVLILVLVKAAVVGRYAVRRTRASKTPRSPH